MSCRAPSRLQGVLGEQEHSWGVHAVRGVSASLGEDPASVQVAESER